MSLPTSKMREFCEITSSKRIFASEYVKSGVPFYRSKEIIERQAGKADVSTEIFISEARFEEIKSKFGAPQRGDLLLTSVGTLGIPYVVKEDERFYFKDGNLTWFRKFQRLNSHYLYYWLLSPQGKAELKKATIGSSQSAYTINLLGELSITPPNFDQQLQVVDCLSAYDSLIATNQRRITLLEDAARRIYREWFVHLRFPGHEAVPMVDGVPQGWEQTPLVEQTVFLNRGVTPTYDEAAPGWVINQKCIRDGRLSMAAARHQSKPVKLERLVQVGDVLINSTGAGTLGRVAQVRAPVENCTVDTHVTIARPLDADSATYFGQAVLSLEPVLSEMGKGSTNQLELSRADIGAMPIWMLPKSLRQDFHRLVNPMLEQAQQLVATNEALAKARDLLLPKLMSGQIDVSGIVLPEEFL